MFWFGVAILFLLATVVFFIGATVVRRTPVARKATRGVAGLAFALFFVSLIFASLVKIPPGHIGIPVVFGDVSDSVYGSGLHLKNPLARVVKISVQERAYTMGYSREVGGDRELEVITALTNEGMKVDIDITVQYRIAPEKTPWILNNKVWTDVDQFEGSYVRPEIRRAIRDVCARYSAQELYSTKRAKVGEEIRGLADKLLKKNGTACVAVNLRNVALPESVTAAIERKKEREQQSQEYEYKLQVEAKEADRKRIEAKGIRDFQLTVKQGIDAQLIQWKGIEAAQKLAESPNTKIIIFGDSKIPVILGGQ